MGDIFNLIRDGNALAIKTWLNTSENDFNIWLVIKTTW
jgi:hypothetical protein